MGEVEEWEDGEYNSRIWEQFPELHMVRGGGGGVAHFGCENRKINKDSS